MCDYMHVQAPFSFSLQNISMWHPPKKKEQEITTDLCGSRISVSMTAVLKGKRTLDASLAMNHNHHKLLFLSPHIPSLFTAEVFLPIAS